MFASNSFVVRLLFFVVFCVVLKNVKAQESIHSSFGNIGNSQHWTYSIGQVFIHEVTGNSNRILPGIQQYFSFGTNQVSELGNKDFLIYPNPTRSEIYIKSEFFESDNVIVLIKGLDGKTVFQTDFIAESPICLIDNPSGIYFLEIRKNEKTLHQHKIIKL